MKITIDQRGRVTVPREILERAGIRPGNKVKVKEIDGKIELSKPSS
jgi:AbrB family looped-hinge helix DNA binding protein